MKGMDSGGKREDDKAAKLDAPLAMGATDCQVLQALLPFRGRISRIFDAGSRESRGHSLKAGAGSDL